MRRAAKRAPMLVALSILFLSSHVRAQWQPNGTAVCAQPGSQIRPVIVPDADGGAVIAWYDNRSGQYDIYAQRIDAQGVVQWVADGVVICADTNSQNVPSIVGDDSGGAFVAWQDSRNGFTDIYIQRIDANGINQWTANGVAICTASNYQSYQEVVANGSGGAIVVWRDDRNGSNSDLYAQSVDATGTVLWATDGVLISGAAGDQFYPQVVADGSGGAIITWEDHRASDQDIYAQRIDATGNVQWTADGVAVCAVDSAQHFPKLVSDGSGGAIITWWDQRYPVTGDIYAQRVDSAGVVQWTPGGVALCTATGLQQSARIAQDGGGGAIVAWTDQRSGADDIYAQRVDGTGTTQWTVDGVAVCTAVDPQYQIDIASDENGGAIVIWADERAMNLDTYGQRLDAGGNPMWESDGVLIHTNVNFYWAPRPQVAADESGNAIVTWEDYRDGNVDVYALYVERKSGLLGSPAPEITSISDVGNDQGRQVQIQFDRSVYDGVLSTNPIHSYEVYRRDDATPAVGLSFVAGISTAQLTAAGWIYIGEAPAFEEPGYSLIATTLGDSTVSSGQYYSTFFIRAATDVPGTFFDSAPDSGYSLDKIPPGVPQNIVYNTGALAWDESNAKDFNYFTVYGGDAGDFGAATVVNYAASPDLDVTGSPYTYYFITATDYAGNEGAPGTINTLTGATDTPRSYVLSVSNYPNPFNPNTTVKYTVPSHGEVTVAVFDARGARLATLVDREIHEAGAYSIEWPGRNGTGHRLSSGLYFVRINHNELVRTRKMVLLK